MYRPPKDTIQFELPAVTHLCEDGRSVLLEAATVMGSGVLVRLRYRDSLSAGDYTVVAAGDTITTPAATVAVRYMIRDVPHVFGFDSGYVALRREGSLLAADVDGWGFESSIRTPAKAEFRDLPFTPDSVPCVFQP